jgi:hypothetical protein
MPKGPRGEKRPADVIGNAVRVMRIATEEETEAPRPQHPSPAARLRRWVTKRLVHCNAIDRRFLSSKQEDQSRRGSAPVSDV